MLLVGKYTLPNRYYYKYVKKMKEEEKYYIPTIDEFFYGYKYEVLERNNWIPQGFGQHYEPYDDIRDNKVRTKYLDKNDIISLGWEYNKNDYSFVNGALTIDDHIYFDKPNYKLIFSDRRKTISLFIEDVTKIKSCNEFGTWVNLQEFPCKSINELKKIMEWLNIESNGNNSDK